MVMKQGMLPALRRLNVAEAKAHLSEVLRRASEAPTVIHNRGRDMAVLLDIATFERLAAAAAGPRETPAAVFVRDTVALRRRHGGGAGEFAPARVAFAPHDPFARGAAGRGQ